MTAAAVTRASLTQAAVAKRLILVQVAVRHLAILAAVKAVADYCLV